MKAKNIGGKIYVRPMPIKDILKHFIEAFKLQFVCLIGGVLTWGRRVPEAAEKSPDVGRRYRCKYLRISLKISNFTSNSNTL